MLSILMPVYNTAPYLSECLDSIRNQSFHDWELIAIDDFSTDSSRRILEVYSRQDTRIRWFRNNKKGIIPALQKAYDISNGDVIHRMDSDDIMPLDKLENLYLLLSRHGPGSVATGKVTYFSDSWKVRRGFLEYAGWINDQIDQETIFDDVFRECPIASPAWMMYRKDIEKIGGVVDGRYPEDYDLVFRMYIHGMEPLGCKKIVHKWRDWSDRASRTKKEYADQMFFDLKLHYFLKYKYHETRPLVLWGAGRKGKKLFKKIRDTGTPVTWVTENPNKTGHNIYGAVLQKPEEVICQHSQVIVAVSEPKGRADICKNMKLEDKQNNEEVFFFC